MSKLVVCIIARATSSRLPLKVLRDLGEGQSLLTTQIRRLKKIEEIDEIYLCTSTEMVDDIMEDIADYEKINIYRGSADRVIERMIAVGEMTEADFLIRTTGDNPLSSVEYIPRQFSFAKGKALDYVRLIGVPIGATVEIISRTALLDCYQSIDPAISEYMMLYLFDPKKYRCGVIKPFEKDYSGYSMTVDVPDDLKRIRISVHELLQSKSGVEDIQLIELLAFFDKNDTLPGLCIPSEGSIKLPYGKTIDFATFKEDIRKRENLSYRLELF